MFDHYKYLIVLYHELEDWLEFVFVVVLKSPELYLTKSTNTPATLP